MMVQIAETMFKNKFGVNSLLSNDSKKSNIISESFPSVVTWGVLHILGSFLSGIKYSNMRTTRKDKLFITNMKSSRRFWILVCGEIGDYGKHHKKSKISDDR